MKGFKQCEKGHFYSEKLSECNYCPQNKTLPSKSDTPASLDNTIETEHIGDSSDKTQVFGPGASTETIPQAESDLDRTIISRPKNERTTFDDGKGQSHQKRKLRGWLVTFDIEDFGIDFKLYEGRNKIGKKSSNEITIQDEKVSSFHGLILYKGKKFILTDELSTNGTFLNGEELVPRNTYELNDGDEIKVGDTSLLFKMAIKI